jgi:drug/metabolite transporter (DMT)-like permease
MQEQSDASIKPRPAMGAGHWGLLLFLSLLWGCSFYFQKTVLLQLHPFTMVFGRLCLAAISFYLVILMSGVPTASLHRHWLGLILLSALNNALPFCLFAWSQTRIATGLAAIFNATAPLFTVLAAHFFTKDERLTPRKVIGIMAGISGVILIIGRGVLNGDRGSILGQLACLIAANCYALAAIYSRRFKEIPPILLSTVQAAISAMIVLPLALLVEHPWKLAMPNLTTCSALLALGLLSTGLAYAIYFRLLARVGATNTVLVTFLIPVTALLLGNFRLHEPLELRQLGGMACIFAGLAIIDGRIVRALSPRPRVNSTQRVPV